MTEDIIVTYLGQVGFLFQSRALTVAIDPFLTDSVDRLPGFPQGFWRRNYPPPIAPQELRGLDLVLCTHDHLDHLDPETLLGVDGASSHCRFAGPRMAVERMIQAGIDPRRTETLNDGKPYRFHGMEIEPIGVAHESRERDAEGFDRFLGYLISWNGRVFFHAGDAVPDAGLSHRLAGRRIDIAFLPINGRDPARAKLGIAGNMNPAEAAAFTVECRIDLVVPTHYDLYSNNGGSLPEFVAELEKRDPLRKFKAFRPGERVVCRP